jgi:hypothetical protein
VRMEEANGLGVRDRSKESRISSCLK